MYGEQNIDRALTLRTIQQALRRRSRYLRWQTEESRRRWEMIDKLFQSNPPENWIPSVWEEPDVDDGKR